MEFLTDGPARAAATLVLAHGAGAPMNSPFMVAVAAGLARHGLRVLRFEFPYMAARRADGRRRPPDRRPVLLGAWRDAIAAAGPADALVIGGKSLGGRMASLIADEAGVRGLVALGFPFHAPGRDASARVAHLAALATPTLIVQGTRDPMGTRAEVAGYTLSPAIRMAWIEGGDHDLVPAKATGIAAAEAWTSAVGHIARFVARLGRS